MVDNQADLFRDNLPTKLRMLKNSGSVLSSEFLGSSEEEGNFSYAYKFTTNQGKRRFNLGLVFYWEPLKDCHFPLARIKWKHFKIWRRRIALFFHMLMRMCVPFPFETGTFVAFKEFLFHESECTPTDDWLAKHDINSWDGSRDFKKAWEHKIKVCS